MNMKLISTLLATTVMFAAGAAMAQQAPPATFENLQTNQSLSLNTQITTFASADDRTGTVAATSTGKLTATDNGYILNLPSVNGHTNYTMDKSANFSSTDIQSGTTVRGTFADAGMTYASYGAWDGVTGSGIVTSGVFASGVAGPAPGNDRPFAGSATYNGKVVGYINMNNGTDYKLAGSVALNADFGANVISGMATGMSVTQLDAVSRANVGAAASTNNIVLAQGPIVGTRFIGEARALDGNFAVPIGGAVGQYGGSFYGPGAAEAAGSLNLTMPGVSVVGAFGASK